MNLIQVFQSVSQLIGPPIAGALFGHGSREEQLDNFPRLIIIGSLLLTVSTVAIVIARFKLDRSWRIVI
jgi:MFS family permease